MKKILVILTFGPDKREDNLEKQLNFFSSYDNPPDIIITDQSIDTWKKKPEAPFIKGVYHYPVSKFSMYEMWEDVLKKYKHEYVCWNNDDDYLNPKAINMAEELIKKDNSFSYICGQVIQITGYKSEIFNDYGYYEWIRKDRNEEDRIQRTKNNLNPFFAFPHGFIKRKVFLKSCSIVNSSSKPNLGPLRFWDKILILVCSMSGNIKSNLNVLSHIRIARNISGEVADFSKDYHQKLERDTPYEEIFERLNRPNPLTDYIYEITSLNYLETYSFICNVLNPKNFKKHSIAKLYPFFPSRTKQGRNFIRKVKNTIIP